MNRVVAIDGPSGSGKSTVSRGVAATLGLEVLDTGAMYRAATAAALRAGLPTDDGDALAALVATLDIDVVAGTTLLDGEDVSAEIRGPAVTESVSKVSAHPSVRAVLVARQRAWVAKHGGGVVEGRDIGSVVFPDACVKVFLTASDEERARRRQRDEVAAAREVSVADVRETHGAPRRCGRDPCGVAPAGRGGCDDGRYHRAQRRGHRRRDRHDVSGCERKLMFYRIARGVLFAVSRLLFRIRIHGSEHVPTSGAFIVAPSHRSYLDTPFVSFITTRQIRFMAKEELFEKSFGRRVFTALGGIPVKRGSASAGVRR